MLKRRCPLRFMERPVCGKFFRGLIVQRRVGPVLIVIDPPVPMILSASASEVNQFKFRAKPAVETFKSACPDEVELHAVILPSHQARGLVVHCHGQNIRVPPLTSHPFQHFHHAGAGDRQGHINRRTFPCAVVFQIDGAELPAVGERIHGEVQDLVGGDRAPGLRARPWGFSCLRQALLSVKSLHHSRSP